MLNDRIVVTRIDFENSAQNKVMFDSSIGICRNLCGYYDDELYHITGEYLLPGNIEIVYVKAKYTRLQRLLIKLLELVT